jgi:hypothetical protein
MLNPYLSLSEPELLDQRNDLLAELKRLRTGVQLASDSVGGKSFSRNRMSVTALREELQLTVTALSAKNPTLYGKLVTETYSDFSAVNGGTS